MVEVLGGGGALAVAPSAVALGFLQVDDMVAVEKVSSEWHGGDGCGEGILAVAVKKVSSQWRGGDGCAEDVVAVAVEKVPLTRVAPLPSLKRGTTAGAPRRIWGRWGAAAAARVWWECGSGGWEKKRWRGIKKRWRGQRRACP